MIFDPTVNGWCLKDGQGRNIFIFGMDGTITFAKVGPYAKVRFAPDGSCIEVSDGQNWRQIPFSYGAGGSGSVVQPPIPTFVTTTDMTKYGATSNVTVNPSTAPIDTPVEKATPKYHDPLR